MSNNLNPQLPNPQKMTPLMYAARQGCLEAVVMLLNAGADASLTDAQDMTALIHAAATGQDGIVSMLLSHDASNINSADANGWTAVHWAVAVDARTTLALLLAQPDVEIHLLTKLKESVFHMAARRGDVDMLSMLVTHYRSNCVNSAIVATRPSLRELLAVHTVYNETAVQIARRLPECNTSLFLEMVLVDLGERQE